MSTEEEQLRLLRDYNVSLLGDEETVGESQLEVKLPTDRAIENESIVMRRRRPVLAVQDGTTTLEFRDEIDATLWRAPLEKAREKLTPAIAAVGRVELAGNPDFLWVGTGWLVHESVLVTNRHVAEAFALHDGEDFVFQPGVDGEMEASIDFFQEIERAQTNVFSVKKVLHIEDRPGPDLAFLEVDTKKGGIAKPIVLSQSEPQVIPAVATIGYPAYDSRIPEPKLMEKIYGSVYDKKRLAPGAITAFDEERVLHNCTTLGGNSGSLVLDLATGEALGLHFSGSFLRTNYAVRSDLLKDRLDSLLAGTLRTRRERASARPRPSATAITQSLTQSLTQAVTQARTQSQVRVSAGSTTVTVPLVITISLGDVAPARSISAREVEPSIEDDTDTDIATEAAPADYANRKGYRTDFLGKKRMVALPEIVRGTKDILTFDGDESVLPYEHFSVVMNAKRRMCFFSACNVDGARAKSSKRTPWRLDPRIPKSAQIMKECYGNAPKFSRGHMTRREDPAWGTATTIQRGADDSMHVTNTTPQMQSFNSPIWLALEDFALQNAREDDMKISVFTGPYFAKNDPTMFGVRIPVKFWKVIAFVHDKTRKLCATGYEMSQEDNLEEPEFVFGDFRSPQLNMSTQVPISTIESRAGISFGDLAELDPLAEEGPELLRPLTRFEQIRFV